ncbi:MAG: alpha/beta hydrolase [Chloroflexi bacterium]|nr:alpha/beta hydrolase [Chloroflexota bacterium]
MRKKLKWIISLALLVIVLAVYLWPVPQKSFRELADKVEPELTAQFLAFRDEHPPQTIEVDGQPWEYIAFGQGDETILFLHGMTGAADIWWRPMNALSDRYRVVAVTYPPADDLAAMSRGALAVLDQLGVEQTNLVGSSLGGYLAQYLVATHPERVRRAVFANTFPPNEIIAEKNKTIGALLPYLPEWLVIDVLRSSFYGSVYPAAGNSELVLAYMLEQSYGRMSKAQVVGRFHGVVDPFTAPDVAALGIPVLIIEADNDPLVEEALREQLKAAYPDAEVRILHAVGHFPYLNAADDYIALLAEFFSQE